MAISTRQEWYDEEHFPDVPPLSFGELIKGFGIKMHVASQRFGKNMQGAVLKMQLMDEAQAKADAVLAQQFQGAHIHTTFNGTASHQLIEMLTGFKVDPIDSNQSPESVRDRALRLKKQPHSMASDHNYFDHRGRRRY